MMNKMKLFGKSAVYSFGLIKRSSQWMILLYFVLNIIGATLPLFSVFLLKYLLDLLTEIRHPLCFALVYILLHLFYCKV